MYSGAKHCGDRYMLRVGCWCRVPVLIHPRHGWETLDSPNRTAPDNQHHRGTTWILLILHDDNLCSGNFGIFGQLFPANHLITRVTEPAWGTHILLIDIIKWSALIFLGKKEARLESWRSLHCWCRCKVPASETSSLCPSKFRPESSLESHRGACL